MKFILSIIIAIFLITCTKASPKLQPVAEKGVLDLSDWDFEKDGPVRLDGEWNFYWKKLILSKKDPKENHSFQTVPGIWNGIIEGTSGWKAFGYGSYQLKLILPANQSDLSLHSVDAGTSHIIWVNGKKFLQNGIVGTSATTSAPQYLPQRKELKTTTNELSIVIEVANFTHHKGGLWESLRIGTNSDIENFSTRKLATDIFLCGSILIMGLYHFGLFSLRRNDKSSFYFACFCIAICFRIVVTGERLMIQIFPDTIWELASKIEYLSIFVSTPLFVLFLGNLYPKETSRVYEKITVIFHLLISLITIITPALFYTHLLITFEIFFLVASIAGVFFLIRAILNKREGAIFAMFGLVGLVCAGLNDVLHSQLIINTGYFLPVGLFLFIFAQSFILSMAFSRAFVSVERLSQNLLEVNSSLQRFVPNEFLQFLGKKTITDISLGDQVQKEMSVLFSDIRSFTELSEKMSPKDNFNFLNSYLGKMAPVIRQNNGFIDKYIGDAIMALFPEQVENAVDAAIAMQRELVYLNEKRISKGYQPIQAGVGIHNGNLMLGTIGEKERMEGTVISDAVNVASRIEGLTKSFGCPIIISEFAIQKIASLTKYRYRKLDEFTVKGKKEPVSIMEILDGQPEDVIEIKIKTLSIFKSGVNYFLDGKMDKAHREFEKVLANHPDDKPAHYLYQRSVPIKSKSR